MIKKVGFVRFTTVPIRTFSYYRKLVFLYLIFRYFFVREFISQSSATVFLMVCQLPTVRYSPRYRIHWIYEFICACNLIMRDSWIDEVHMSASWLCSLFLSHLLSLGSSDRSHNGVQHHHTYLIFQVYLQRNDNRKWPCTRVVQILPAAQTTRTRH